MKILIKGTIVNNDDKWIYDWFDIESTCPKDVTSQIEKANGEELEVEINSGGGDVYAGSEIFTALKSYTGNSVGKIVGIAGSAASVAAMGVNKLLISPTAQLMIHNVWSSVAGDYRVLEHESKVLKGHNEGIANAYILKTGKTQEELMRLMDETTYFNAQEALKHKFVDEIMFNESKQIAASMGGFLLPQEVVNKMRNHLKASPQSKKNEKELIQARLNYLKLKGGCNYE